MTLQDLAQSCELWIGDLIRETLEAHEADSGTSSSSRHEIRCEMRGGKLQISVHQQAPGAALANCVFAGAFAKKEAKAFLGVQEAPSRSLSKSSPDDRVANLTGAGAEARIEAINQIASKHGARVNAWSGEGGQTRHYINLPSADRQCAGDQKTKLWFDENGKVVHEPGSGKKSSTFKSDLERILRDFKISRIEVSRLNRRSSGRDFG